jgi:predicted RNA-binding protein with PUA-like domain
MALFLVKTEPDDYSFADLQKDKKTVWSGVSNPAALIQLRLMKVGDEVLVYHTGDEKAIVGLAKVVKGAYEDPKQPGKNDRGGPKNAVVELAAVKPVKTPVTLGEIKADARFKELGLVKQSRLSVMAVPAGMVKPLLGMLGI